MFQLRKTNYHQILVDPFRIILLHLSEKYHQNLAIQYVKMLNLKLEHRKLGLVPYLKYTIFLNYFLCFFYFSQFDLEIPLESYAIQCVKVLNLKLEHRKLGLLPCLVKNDTEKKEMEEQQEKETSKLTKLRVFVDVIRFVYFYDYDCYYLDGDDYYQQYSTKPNFIKTLIQIWYQPRHFRCSNFKFSTYTC